MAADQRVVAVAASQPVAAPAAAEDIIEAAASGALDTDQAKTRSDGQGH
jgi:hypothetical protein